MTWTYDSALGANKDKVRFYCGDTSSSAPITLTDEEIAGILSISGGPRSAAAICCESLAARYSAQAQSLTDDIGQSVTYGDRAKQFLIQARMLRSQLALSALPFAGGITVTDKDANAGNDTLVQPDFTKQLHDDPGLGQRVDGTERA